MIAGLIIGFMIGGFFGILMMCIFAAAKETDKGLDSCLRRNDNLSSFPGLTGESRDKRRRI